jgi:hypothetical protein
MTRVGVFASPDEARIYKQIVEQLRSSGFLLQGGQQRPPVFEAPQEYVVYNSSGEIVPPFAVMQCISSQKDVIEIQKPADRYGVNGPYLINAGKEIPIDSRGVGRNAGPIVVHTDASATTALQRMSAEEDEWYAIQNPAGCFLYLGDSELRESGDCVFAIVDGYPNVIHAKTTGSGIPGATGTSIRTMQFASCDLYFSDNLGVIGDTLIDIDIFNFSSTAVGASRFVLASRNDAGLWVVTAEDCPA